ncbi:MAG: hypothetical protein LBQ12_10105 [Deltaproteobacteria bacterium]|jgi:hypothetical protein|nr:hypothetical protein [Deltaproteobacteria bacterium]
MGITASYLENLRDMADMAAILEKRAGAAVTLASRLKDQEGFKPFAGSTRPRRGGGPISASGEPARIADGVAAFPAGPGGWLARHSDFRKGPPAPRGAPSGPAAGRGRPQHATHRPGAPGRKGKAVS